MKFGKAAEFLGLIPAVVPLAQKLFPSTVLPAELRLPDSITAIGTTVTIILSVLAFAIVFVLAHRPKAKGHFWAGLVASLAGIAALVAYWLYAGSDLPYSKSTEVKLVLVWCSAFVLLTSGTTLMLTVIKSEEATPQPPA